MINTTFSMLLLVPTSTSTSSSDDWKNIGLLFELGKINPIGLLEYYNYEINDERTKIFKMMFLKEPTN